MPIYEYERGDGTRFEIHQNFADEPLQTDPETGTKVRQVFSAPKITHRSEGTHSTSYRTGVRQDKASKA
ncbi:MAG: FmdB family zinc ribbon protein [Solirubrobacteraceae bacterium]